MAEEEDGIVAAATVQEENLRKILAGPEDEIAKAIQDSATP